MKLYCHRYTHFKDPLVCVVVCPFRTRCADFALFYDANREAVDALATQHYKNKQGARATQSAPSPRAAQTPRPTNLTAQAARTELRDLISLEVKKIMTENMFIWVDKENQAHVLKLEDILQRAENGEKAKRIYKIAQEMELKFQVVPRRKIEKVKAKAAADEERAAARQTAKRSKRVAGNNGDAADEFDEFINDEPPVTSTPPRPRAARAARAAK